MRVVDAALDDGGRHQHVDLARGELDHDVLHLARAHLAVRHAHARLGHHLVHALHRIIDGLHAVRYVVDLAAAVELQANRRRDHVRIVLAHVDDDRAPARWRRGDEAHIAHARNSHLHGARNRRCRKREHVDLLAQVLELLFMLHAEALLLVDDHQAQVVGVDVGGKQAVRAHQHVHLALREGCQRAALLCGGAETAEHLDLDSKRSETLEERLVVLLGENGGGAQHHNLAPAVHAFERGAQGHLRLAKAHVAAKQAIHWFGALHIALDIGDGVQLVMRGLVRKALLHLDLIRRIRSK